MLCLLMFTDQHLVLKGKRLFCALRFIYFVKLVLYIQALFEPTGVYLFMFTEDRSEVEEVLRPLVNAGLEYFYTVVFY